MNPSRVYTRECLDAAFGTTSHGEAHRRTGTPRSIPIFRSRFVETVFAKAHPITPILWFGPVIGYAAYRAVMGRSARAISLFAAGWLLWSLLEYVLHRFLFHMHAESPKEKLRAFLMHGYHHQFPSDPMRLVAPPLMSWPLAVAVGAGYYFLAGAGSWLWLFAGTCTGYIAYDWIHYYTHHFRPKWWLGKWLRTYHMLHHFDDHGTRYGISSPLWDFVFRTYRPLKARRSVAPSSQNAAEGAASGTQRVTPFVS